ncbi:MAG: pyrophosphatase PpaX [Firmicutes bacterium]|nr:pyrophosphatase PpaX [Bacillota bacterium]
MQPFSCILFDLDGTVLNTNALIIKSFQHTLSTHLGLQLADEEFHPYFGEPLRDTLARYDANRVDELITTYREFMYGNHDELVKVFPGTFETMEALHKAGIKLGVVTSKLKMTSQWGLKLFGLDQFIRTCITIEDVKNPKPHPEPIELALHQLSQGKEGALMVGDSPYDLRCALNAGVSSAAVGWSVHPRETLQEQKPHFVLGHFSDLLDICGLKNNQER